MKYPLQILTVILCLNCMPQKIDTERMATESILLNLSIRKKVNAIEHQLRTIQMDTILVVNRDSIQTIALALTGWKVEHQKYETQSEGNSDVKNFHELDLSLSRIAKRLHHCIPTVRNFGVYDSLQNSHAR